MRKEIAKVDFDLNCYHTMMLIGSQSLGLSLVCHYYEITSLDLQVIPSVSLLFDIIKMI